MSGFMYIPHLRGFGYREVPKNLTLCLADTDYFKNQVLRGEKKWNGTPVRELFDKAEDPPFDSGIICALTADLLDMGAKSEKLSLFAAPYRLMKATISGLPAAEGWKGHRKIEIDPAEESLAVGIGMVLTVVAKKGHDSAESAKEEEPFIVLTVRNNKLRENSLDVAVVEGLYYKDFEEASREATLEGIAIRALEEERGINVPLLQRTNQIHLPPKYYLGYDERYHQWNFYGTVEINLSPKEIIEMGQYFTCDEFETRTVACIPMDRAVLSHYLSLDNIVFSDSWKGKEMPVKTKDMWNTAWASISFALWDTGDSRKGLTAACLRCKDSSLLRRTVYRIDWLAERFAKKEAAWEMLGAVGSALVPAAVLLWTIWGQEIEALLGTWAYGAGVLAVIERCKELAGNSFLEKGISVLFAVIAVIFLVTHARAQVIRKRPNLICLNTFSLDDISTNHNGGILDVFDRIVLRDGCVAKDSRRIFLSLSADPTCGHTRISRKCNLFVSDARKGPLWTITEESAADAENMSWVLPRTTARVIVVCMDKNRNRLLVQRDENGAWQFPVSFSTDWEDYSRTDDGAMRELIGQTTATYIRDHLGYALAGEEMEIQLLFEEALDDAERPGGEKSGKGKGPKEKAMRPVIVAFMVLEGDIPAIRDGMRHLSDVKTAHRNSNYVDMDLGRVAAMQYAYVKYIGYTIDS